MSIDLDTYRDLFVQEAREHLAVLARGVETLAGAAPPSALPAEEADALFRAAHSLKGMAATLGLDGIAQLAHELEDSLDQIRSGKQVAVAPLAAVVDALEMAVAAVAAAPGPGSPSPAAGPAVGDEQATTVAALPTTLRVSAEMVDRLLDRAVALHIHEERLVALVNEVVGPRPSFALTQAMTRLQHAARELHRDTLDLRAVPITLATGQLPRRAREVAARHGKDVRLDVRGADTRVDRALLEAIRDPLQHLVTNAVAHGIEVPPVRRAAGKDPTGMVTIEITRDATALVVTVADDGVGIDPERVREHAVAEGIVDAAGAARLDDEAVLGLLARPGFSLAAAVSEEAGRGVGLDAAARAAQQAGGTMRIRSTRGAGTRVTLVFPPALELVEVIDCEIGDAVYALPAAAVARVIALPGDAVAAGEVVVRNAVAAARTVSVVDLATTLGLTAEAPAYPAEEGDAAPVVRLAARLRGGPLAAPLPPYQGAAAPRPRAVGLLVHGKAGELCLAVDRVGSARIAAVKPLEVPGGPPAPLTGATVLDDGRVAPLFDPAHLGPRRAL